MTKEDRLELIKQLHQSRIHVEVIEPIEYCPNGGLIPVREVNREELEELYPRQQAVVGTDTA